MSRSFSKLRSEVHSCADHHLCSALAHRGNLHGCHSESWNQTPEFASRNILDTFFLDFVEGLIASPRNENIFLARGGLDTFADGWTSVRTHKDTAQTKKMEDGDERV